ncbi:efflux RND transporter permease subunit [Halapricum hydrolyticum]|uniref:MMPL family transporter n=1 Tax=Halapricum hydrolyticum TaxID=2979991 RepID=A0AAE3IHE2_9EURY|nr:MMPL family transporter [Halapricum hydrolyticum]MCU4719411.1 MMPL family transporter [Halapricum hydrolyticum]MCU4728420.1 MMPL family transporter [Halapricum hydrolyticum]
MAPINRLAGTIATHSRATIVLLLVFTAVVGSGAGLLAEDTSMDQYYSSSDAGKALDYVQRNFSADDNATYAQVVVRDDNVLSKGTLLETLRFQRSLEANRTINRTLGDAPTSISVANIVARSVIAAEPGPGPTQNATVGQSGGPTLDEQIARLETIDQATIDRTVRTLLDPETAGPAGALELMPTGYEPGSTTANATMIVVTQRTEDAPILDPDQAPAEIIDSQQAMQSIAESFSDRKKADAMVFGVGAMGGEITQTMEDSLGIVGPLALAFVLTALIIAYRDPVDIVLGVVGVGIVLVWTFGVMGWAGIDFNQLHVAIPVLLIGLSIDFALHVVMRYREQRQNGDDIRGSMTVSLADIGVALMWVTITTAIGFLANLLSPVGPIQDFAIASSVGVVSALVVFGALLPALKIEIDGALAARGFDRKRRAFGTGGGRFSRFLSLGSWAARTAPLFVIVLVVLVSTAGLYGATGVETRFAQEDFLADDPPAWTEHLPAELEPHEYTVKENMAYINDHFARRDAQVSVLVRGDVTDPETLDRLATAREEAGASAVTQQLSTGDPRIRSPIEVMERAAANNASFATTLRAADTDSDGLPDRNVDAVYDALFAAAPEHAEDVIHRADGEYRALRLVVMTGGDATHAEVADGMRSVAAVIDGDSVQATATGNPVLFEIVADELFDTFVTTLSVALVTIAVVLIAGYRLAGEGATLGALTVVPVVIVLLWILGTMNLLDIPFNAMTGMITSLTIGLGVDYSIHLGTRYTQELEAGRSPANAMRLAVTGTGGALLGSAATTAAGFGVLVFALLPGLRDFGAITALTIVYAFVVAVFVFPSFLVVWTDHVGLGGFSPSQSE